MRNFFGSGAAAAAAGGDRRRARKFVDRGIAAEKSGNATKALQYFRRAVAADNGCAEAHLNLGIALQAAGEIAAATASYERAIGINPEYAAAHYNLARAHLLRSQYTEAETEFRFALRFRGALPEAWVGLADALEALGRSEDALSALNRAIALRSDYVGALLNTFALLRKLGRIEEAVANSRRVLELEPENYLAHGTLGIGLQVLGRLSDAEASYRLALTFNPDYVEAKVNLVSILQATGRTQEAISLLFALVANEPANSQMRRRLAGALDGLALLSAGEKERAILLSLCMDEDSVESLVPSILALAKNDKGFQELQEDARRNEVSFTSVTPAVAAFLREPLLRAVLPRVPIADGVVEEVLTHIRRCILLRFEPASGLGVVDPEIPAEFTCALARQCFFSGYAFFADESELQRVASLRETLQDRLREGSIIPPTLESSLAVASLYDSLHTLKGCERLLEQPIAWSAAFRPIAQEQIENRKREREIVMQLASITTIDSENSMAVRAQYEENPYPRWVTLASPDPDTLEKLFSRLRPDREDRIRPHPVPVLIAGCGTGRNPISFALAFPESQILAIDLSLASLGYAARMTEQRGISNITYRQADILKLGNFDARYAVIECLGVLHHFDEPLAGWQVLVGLLEQDGLMRIALYSERARRAVRAAREFARTLNFPSTPEGIRNCRHAIMELPDGHLEKNVMICRDFFTLDGCRDLIMHVKEHQFTIPRIEECLNQLNLRFIGFECSTKVWNRFREMFPDDAMNTDLRAWDRYEEAYPETFLGMYSFWCCRK